MDKPSEKFIISVNFQTGEITGRLEEYYRKQKIIEGENSMPEPIKVTKEDFLKAYKNCKSVKKTATALGISIGSFYKLKEMYAEDIIDILQKEVASKPEHIPEPVRIDPVDADYTKEDPTDFAVINVKPEVELVDPEPWPEYPEEANQSCQSESFFNEAATVNPKLPKDNQISVLEAITILEDLREESDSVETIFECMKNQSWHPNIRSILMSHKLEVDRQIERIETALSNITVAI